MSARTLRTGALADTAGVNVQTVRYYERRGLLPEPERTLGGHRLYPMKTVTVVRIIKAAQRLGFTLDDAAELLAAGGRHHGSRGRSLHDRAAARLAEVETRLAELSALRDTLRAALEVGCHDLMTCASTESCPLPFGGLAATSGAEVDFDRPAT